MSGTIGDDAMNGDGGDNHICGFAGNDRIALSVGNDIGIGNSGNAIIDGSLGSDTIVGGSETLPGIGSCRAPGGGGDTLNGPGDDQIFHDIRDTPLTTPANIASDGARDMIDCGTGNDEAWINTSVDGDIAVHCEIVHAG